MVETFLTKFSIALIVFSLITLIQRKRIFREGAMLTLFFAVFFLDNFLIVLSNSFNNLQIIPNTIWENFLVCSWSGKIYSIICVLLLLYFVRKLFRKEEIGLSLHQTPGSILPACIVIFSLAAWALIVGMSSPKGKLDIPTLAYLVVMPGFNEELVYRGILLAILVKIIPGNINLLGAPFGWGAVVTSILFGLLHGFRVEQTLSIHVEMVALRNATISGMIFAWLKARTGSLITPVIAHGLEDFLFFLPRMM